MDSILELEEQQLQTKIKILITSNTYVNSMMSICQESQNGNKCIEHAKLVYENSKYSNGLTKSDNEQSLLPT